MTTKRPRLKNRWRCPSCKGTKVQVGLPAWFIEREDYSLRQVEIDAEADIMWWYCPDCGETDTGSPEPNPTEQEATNV